MGVSKLLLRFLKVRYKFVASLLETISFLVNCNFSHYTFLLLYFHLHNAFNKSNNVLKFKTLYYASIIWCIFFLSKSIIYILIKISCSTSTLWKFGLGLLRFRCADVLRLSSTNIVDAKLVVTIFSFIALWFTIWKTNMQCAIWVDAYLDLLGGASWHLRLARVFKNSAPSKHFIWLSQFLKRGRIIRWTWMYFYCTFHLGKFKFLANVPTATKWKINRC